MNGRPNPKLTEALEKIQEAQALFQEVAEAEDKTVIKNKTVAEHGSDLCKEILQVAGQKTLPRAFFEAKQNAVDPVASLISQAKLKFAAKEYKEADSLYQNAQRILSNSIGPDSIMRPQGEEIAAGLKQCEEKLAVAGLKNSQLAGYFNRKS